MLRRCARRLSKLTVIKHRFRSMSAHRLAVLVLACSTAFLRAERIPWVLPWNDSTASSATDFSAMNLPITTNWVKATTNGQFQVNGERIRFLGVNFAGDSPFMPTNNAEGVAARLAKYGVNNVRFHHMDASWAYQGGLLSYTSTKSTNFNATNLERLHFLVARLKAHGIYSDINLLVGREYRSQDGLGDISGMDWKDLHILGFFYPPALALHKDYATKLLAPTNRFTGLPLAKDPAVSFVEVINENGVFQKWLDKGLDNLPSRFTTNLQARWNDWLYAKYTNDAAMLAAWKTINQPLGPNLLANGAFSNGLTGWITEQHNLAKATFQRTYDFTNGAPSAKITVTNVDSAGWYIQMNYPSLSLSSNQAYTVSYWAKSEPATNASASVMQAHDPWQNLGYNQGLALTTNWQRFTNTFMPSQTDNNARVGFSDMGNKPLSFWYADVRFQQGGQLGSLPAGTSLASRTVPNIAYSGSGFTGTRDARRDWVRFLRDLERAYYQEMVEHIRSNLGYPGLVFGTIMANSPATIQSELDVIDSHAYWQHPQFPGTPWDSVNWLVPNISMVNTIGDDNTLAGISRQRIKGKPFVVTEYQHSSPNYYGAEAPLMLAAYAGLQDWDGLWLFDYGHGNPNSSATMGYVRGFFEIGQHPTKMPNLLLAANLFRRGDVRPALNEYTMALTPDREVELLLNTYAWGVFSGGQLGLPGKMPFVSRVSTSVGSNAVGLPAPPATPAGNVMTSDTGELVWDVSRTNAGVFRLNTPRTKMLLGYATNRVFSFDGISVTPGINELGWCTWGMTLRRGEVFTNDCSALIVATGWWENTNQVWKDATRNSVGNQWGGPPVLTEVIPFTMTLPIGTNHVRVWSLNELGQRKAQLPMTGTSTSTTLTITSGTATVWYELEVARWTAQFDLWRARYFSATELTQPEISGAAAAPDGDRMANLIKYFAGLPGRTPAAPEAFPSGGLLSLSNQLFLSMTYQQDKLVSDVACIPELSTNLVTWFSGPAYTRVESIADLGSTERITVRELSPAASGQRYLRLRFSR